ncbi:MAG: BCD family MFS transporter, partial [Chloroflexi bacterium]|nr:BCD family MFS transporter [Chloroflexota bacterium]
VVMSLVDVSHAGLFLGIWGIVQALAQGIGVIGGSLVRDIAQATTGDVVVGYTQVYTIAAILLVVVLALIIRMGNRLRVDQIRMPWSGVEEIPADQLVF